MNFANRFHIAPLIFAALLAIAVFVRAPLPGTAGSTAAPPAHPDSAFTRVYDRLSPSVVAISLVNERGGGAGSGFVIDQRGHIVTNAHVVDEADEIVVNFFDGSIVRGELVGLDRASDIAVIRAALPSQQLHPVAFADSDALDIGQTVLAIGSPFGQRWTLTSGIISGLDRTIRGMTEFSVGGVIQTDASINPGNSGGPLINLSGEVIGVNSQIISESRSSAGVGFAVPANLTQRIAQALIENGEMVYSLIGISGSDVSLTVIELLGLPSSFRGVVVREISDGGPAAQSDLQEIAEMRTLDGDLVAMRVDIITAVDGHPIAGMNALITYLAHHTQPEQEIALSVLRDGGDVITVPLTLGSR